MKPTTPAESADDSRIGVAVTEGHDHLGVLLSSVLARTVAFVEALEHAAEEFYSSAPEEAAHVRHLGETVSGIVLDYVREWPS